MTIAIIMPVWPVVGSASRPRSSGVCSIAGKTAVDMKPAFTVIRGDAARGDTSNIAEGVAMIVLYVIPLARLPFVLETVG